ncbi:MAG: hypothetical protein FJX53_04290 [Alphaproteobacteria bacterium]|nr:hypothetical protein [Alphaproteobacteria bacterium]
MSEQPKSDAGVDGAAMSRRRALAKLGLAAAVAYAAPTDVRLDRTASAKVSLSPCPPAGKGKPKPGC